MSEKEIANQRAVGNIAMDITPQDVVDCLEDELLVIDSDYKVRLVNLAVRHRLQKGAESLVGGFCYKVLYDRNSPCSKPLWECPLTEVLQTGRMTTVTHHICIHEAGKYLEITAYPLRDNYGKPKAMVELRKDVTATRELEQASREITKLEEERSRFLRFLGTAAHDLKAPLTAIQGFLWVMLGGFSGELNQKQRHMLERSSRRITELLELISDLLDIPRIEIGVIVEERDDVSLLQVVKRSLDDVRNLAKQKEVKLKVKLPQSLPKIRGSTPRLQRVITELLTNATNYSPGGSVTIMVNEENSDIRVEVMDTGIGIPHEELPRVFDEFFRASNVDTRGTGLGLSIVKRLVETHGGRIWVESPCLKSSKGSKFTFTLPKKSET
jgi:signal transduction histidine kinase